MEKYAVHYTPEQHAYQSQSVNPNGISQMPQPVNQLQYPEQKYPQQQPNLPSQNNVNVEWPQSVNNSFPPTQQPQNPQQPYPNTLPVYYVQPFSGRLASPPSDYLAWSIANTVCAVLFTLWA